MPGILPMKVIKVGTNSQSRIAQACDRCRSKKIRCDGFRPTCSQCSNVGFECKTSDKLSRRAFPRGYTESLEERVRSLESETREFKDLLDEKDEKIEMLSRVQSQYSGRQSSIPRRASSTASPAAQVDVRAALQQEKDDVFIVQQSPFLHAEGNNEPYFTGTSSGRSFIDAFKRKLQESGRSCTTFESDTFFPSIHPRSSTSIPTSPGRIKSWIAPPRLLSDEMVNIFFQQWAPLFPVLHRPTFLALYEKYVSGPDTVKDMESLTQLNLVFGIAALSSSSRISHDIERCEAQWEAALREIMFKTSMTSLQCLILAQLYSLQKGDFQALLRYKSLAIGISQRLGLHQSQKRFALGVLTSETRKKVFWTLYTLDCFSASVMGLPKLMREEDIHCEYPVDADDEYVTEQGFQPTLPGEATKLSAALALFRACRILSKTLDEIYPTSASHEISLRNITALDDELEDWNENLAPHLRLQFVQGKPSTHIISSRCPLLSLTFNYIRMLIHRPVVCANLGEKASSSIMKVAASSKNIVMILKLLEERSLSFSVCLNKNELLVLAGFGLLFQALDLDKDGKLIQDSQRLVYSVIEALSRGSAPGALEFQKIGCDMFGNGKRSGQDHPSIPIRNGDMSPPRMTGQAGPQLTLAAARYATDKLQKKEQKQGGGSRRSAQAALPTPTLSHASTSIPTVPSLSSMNSESSECRHVRSFSASSTSNSSSRVKMMGSPMQNDTPNTNLDYFSFPNDPTPPPGPNKYQGPTTADWEQLLAIDTFQSGLQDNMYSTSTMNDALISPKSQPASTPDGMLPSSKAPFTSPPDDSHASNSDFLWVMADSLSADAVHPAQSVLSFSDDSLTSGEEFSSAGESSSNRSNSAYRGIVMPHFGQGDGDGLDFDDLAT